SRLTLRWIDHVVSSDDEESMRLGVSVARLLPQADQITIPRPIFRQVSSGEVGPAAEAWISGTRTRLGGRGNALVVDQAAHHFRTYSAVKSLLDRIGWHSLAFGVVLDRTGVSADLPHLLHDTRYAWLYQWPFPPRTRLDCGCDV